MGFWSLERVRRHIRSITALVGLTCVGLLAVQGIPSAGAAAGNGSIDALSTSQVPDVPGLNRFIRDSGVANRLGKALFWDMQAGSDGRQACASCHFNAGADNRSRNQLNPRGGGFTLNGKAANAQLTADDFPFHRLSDPNNAASAVTFDTDNVSGSQGVLPSHFTGVSAGDPF